MMQLSLPSLAATLPPFSWNLIYDIQVMLSYDFMRNAFITGTVVALVAGLVGYFTVLRQLIFAGDALSHLTFTGALGAAVLSLNPLVGIFGLTTLAALVMGNLGERRRGRDVAVGIVLAWTLGIGVLFLSIYTANASASHGSLGINVLFGSILGVQTVEMRVAVLLGVGVMLALLAIARPLLFATIDPEVAAARGAPVRLLSIGFLILLAITVGEAVQVVGALLIFALLVTPAAIALRLTTRPYRGLALSALLALLITWIGLTIAFYTPYPVSFLISALAFVLYIATRAGAYIRRQVRAERPAVRRSPLRESAG